MSSPQYQTPTFGLWPTLFMPTKQSADQFFNNLTDLVDLTDEVVAAQQQLVLSYFTAGTRIAEALCSPGEAARHEESNNGTREVPEQAGAESDEVDVSDDSIRDRAYQLHEQRDRRPGDALDDWNRARADDSIRDRAYQLYEQRDRRPGDALDDWSRARAELQAAARH